jgi:epoxyqueuosine reductase
MLSDNIKSLAIESGFNSVGITSAEPFMQSRQLLYDRLEQGMIDGVGITQDSILKMTTPKMSLPNAKSIVSLGVSYLTDDENDPIFGMARFSRGTDYHAVMQDMQNRLIDAIKTKLGVSAEFKAFADTGPISDRSAAIRSGLGSQGKNGCIYSSEYGSWIVLGELITSIELKADDPASADICGDCTLCIDSCPTAAISAPYTIDVRKCISQATQCKGFIPLDLRAKMGNSIYGCDICQNVCPLNIRAKAGNHQQFIPANQPKMDINHLMLLTVDDFRKYIKPMTAGWIRRQRIRRNAIVAAGNSGDDLYAEALASLLSDEAPVIRGHAAWSLGMLESRLSKPILEKALLRESDPQAKIEITAALDIL